MWKRKGEKKEKEGTGVLAAQREQEERYLRSQQREKEERRKEQKQENPIDDGVLYGVGWRDGGNRIVVIDSLQELEREGLERERRREEGEDELFSSTPFITILSVPFTEEGEGGERKEGEEGGRKPSWDFQQLPALPSAITAFTERYNTFLAFYTPTGHQCMVSPAGRAVALYHPSYPFFACDTIYGRVLLLGDSQASGRKSWQKCTNYNPWLVITMGYTQSMKQRREMAQEMDCTVISVGSGKGTLMFTNGGRTVSSCKWVALEPNGIKYVDDGLKLLNSWPLPAPSSPSSTSSSPSSSSSSPSSVSVPVPTPKSKTKLVKVACLQAPSKMAKPEENLVLFLRLAREAAQAGAKFIVLPETAVTGYLSQDLQTNWYLGKESGRKLHPQFKSSIHPQKYAEPMGWKSLSVQKFAEISAEFGVYISVPYLEKGEGQEEGKYYNSISLVGPKEGGEEEGEKEREVGVLAHYRKNVPWPHPETSWATAGTSTATAVTPYGTVGLAICFDHTEMVGRYAMEHPNMWCLLYSIAWVDGNPLQIWFHENLPEKVEVEGQRRFHVVGCNWSVSHLSSMDHDWYGYGCSTVLHRSGAVMASAESCCGEEIVYAYLPYDE